MGVRVVFSKRHRCFVEPAKRGRRVRRYRGITKLINARLCSGAKWPRGPAKKHKVKAYGRRSGAAIDRLVSRHINAGTWNTLRSGECKQFFDALQAWGLEPLAAQVAVCDQYARLATAIDIVARDQAGQIAVLELKCGYETNFETKTNVLPGKRLCHLQASPLLAASFQACFGAKMYAKNSGAVVSKIAVVQIARGAIRYYPVAQNVLACVEAAYKRITLR